MPTKFSDGRDDMAIDRLRMHVAVADRRRRLDAEEEEIGEAAAARIGDRRVAETVDQRENEVQRDETPPRAPRRTSAS